MVLFLIWSCSLVLSTAAVVIMMCLVLRRLVLDRAERRREVVRRALTELTLGYLGDTVSLEEIRASPAARRPLVARAVITELSQMMRGHHIDRLAHLGREIGIVDNLLKELGHRRTARRANAARDLAMYREQRVIDSLMKALDDPEVDVHLAAADTLVQLDAIESVGDFIARLGIGYHLDSRALMKIFRRLAPGRIDQFIALLESDAPDPVKVLLLDALGESGDYSALNAMLRSAMEGSVQVRSEALRALSHLEHPGALPAVQRGLADPAWEIRAQAAKCAGRIILPETIDTLASLLSDEQWWVRLRSAESLSKLGPQGLQILEDAQAMPTNAGRIARVVIAQRMAA